MIIVQRPDLITGDLEGDIRRLETLLADLKRLANRDFPTAKELAAAPLIDRYSFSLRAEPCVEGRIIGHPKPRGPRSFTSSVWVYAADLGWVRSLNRLYRLGRPAGDDQQMH